MGKKVELRVELDLQVCEKIAKLSSAFKVKPEDLTSILLEVLSLYSDDISKLGGELLVSEDKKAISAMEELIYYGVESWRSMVNTLLEFLGAKGCYEIESIDFEPLEPLLEVEMVALENCKFKAERIVLSWSPKGALLEVFYPLESGTTPSPQTKIAYEWSYIPGENAILVSITSPNIIGIPKIDVIDREVEKLGL